MRFSIFLLAALVFAAEPSVITQYWYNDCFMCPFAQMPPADWAPPPPGSTWGGGSYTPGVNPHPNVTTGGGVDHYTVRLEIEVDCGNKRFTVRAYDWVDGKELEGIMVNLKIWDSQGNLIIDKTGPTPLTATEADRLRNPANKRGRAQATSIPPHYSVRTVDFNCEGQCVLATAAYGWFAVEPYRRYRDAMLRDTFVGAAAASWATAFYYSWSPHLAPLIEQNAAVKAVAMAVLLPFLAAMHTASLVYAPHDAAALLSVFVFALVLSTYLAPLAFLLKPPAKPLPYLYAAAFATASAALAMASFTLMQIATILLTAAALYTGAWLWSAALRLLS